MQRGIKSRGLFALCAAALAPMVLAGCGETTSTSQSAKNVHASSTSEALVLRLDAGSYAITGTQTALRGTATPRASVRVNGQFVALRHGRWRQILRPHLGRNRVVVEATMSGHAPVIRSITVTRHRTPAEVEAHERAKREAENRALAKREAARRAAERAEKREIEAEAPSACTNGTYTNSAGNTVCKPEHSSTVPEGATAKCEDGTYSFSESRSGTCSHHGGVAEWLSE